MRAHEYIQLGPIRGLADYTPIRKPGLKITTGWLLRLEIDDHAIEGWGATQDEAKFMLLETAKQWLKDTNRPVAIR